MDNNIVIVQVPINDLKAADYNPRRWQREQVQQLKESIQKFGMVDAIIANSAEERKNIVIGGHFRLFCAKQLGFETVPVIYVNIPDVAKEVELNIRLNKNSGEWDNVLLSSFDINLLADIGFTPLELDFVFNEDPDDLKKVTSPTPNMKILESRTRVGDTFFLGDYKINVKDIVKSEIDVDPYFADALIKTFEKLTDNKIVIPRSE